MLHQLVVETIEHTDLKTLFCGDKFIIINAKALTSPKLLIFSVFANFWPRLESDTFMVNQVGVTENG